VLWLWHFAHVERVRTGKSSRRKGLHRIANHPSVRKKSAICKPRRKTLAAILDNALYADHLRKTGRTAVIMVGYSDSTRMAVIWPLWELKGKTICIKLAAGTWRSINVLPWGGGSLGRGGGPAARGILSLPPDALGARSSHRNKEKSSPNGTTMSTSPIAIWNR